MGIAGFYVETFSREARHKWLHFIWNLLKSYSFLYDDYYLISQATHFEMCARTQSSKARRHKITIRCPIMVSHKWQCMFSSLFEKKIWKQNEKEKKLFGISIHFFLNFINQLFLGFDVVFFLTQRYTFEWVAADFFFFDSWNLNNKLKDISKVELSHQITWAPPLDCHIEKKRL